MIEKNNKQKYNRQTHTNAGAKARDKAVETTKAVVCNPSGMKTSLLDERDRKAVN